MAATIATATVTIAATANRARTVAIARTAMPMPPMMPTTSPTPLRRRSGVGDVVGIIGGIGIAVRAIATVLARFAVAAIVTVAVAIVAAIVAAILARLLLAAGLLAGVGNGVVAVVLEALILVVERILAATTLVLALVLLFEAAAAFGQHAEVMIRELQIIFGVDAIALALRIGGEGLVLFEQLAGVAAGAIVDPVARIGVAATLALSTPTATAAGLTIVIDQSPVVLVSQTKPGLAPIGCKLHTPSAPVRTRRPVTAAGRAA